MRIFYQLPHFAFSSQSGFAYKDVPNETLETIVDCAGTTLATAASFWPSSYESAVSLKRVTVFARYVDASNYAVKIPFQNPDYHITIFASALSFPSSGSIEVFLPFSNTFVDGTASISAAPGTGKTFRVLGVNSGNLVWGCQG